MATINKMNGSPLLWGIVTLMFLPPLRSGLGQSGQEQRMYQWSECLFALQKDRDHDDEFAQYRP